MKIGILVAGYPPQELAHRGSYANMLQRWYTQKTEQTMEPVTEIKVFKALEGELPPSADYCDVWLLSGSRHGVYDPLPWIQPLKLFIQKIHQAQITLIGICFGHQIIAEALGGKVEKSAKGWGIGLHSYQINHDFPTWLNHPQQDITFNAFHQDQIVQRPAEAEVILHSGFCQFAGLVYGKHILTMQGHPEFSIEFEKELMQIRKYLFTAELFATSLTKLNQADAHTDHHIAAHWAQQLTFKNRNI